MLPRCFSRFSVVALGWAMGAIAASAHPPVMSCPAEQAVFRLQTEDGPLETGFIPATNFISAASDLYLYLTTPQRTTWFSFSLSHGHSGLTPHPGSVRLAPSNATKRVGPRELPHAHFGQG